MSTSMADASYITKFGHVVENEEYGQLVLTFDKHQICKEILKELHFNVIENLLSSIFQ